MTEPATYFIWNVQPYFRLWDLVNIRYYSLLFIVALLLGTMLFRWQMRRFECDDESILKFLFWGTIAIVIGSRLFHCIFYAPQQFLSNPWEAVMSWKGGLSSHGATIGLILALCLFAVRFKYPIGDVLDSFTMSAALGAALVRVGNFMNSEIVGRVTDLPWAVRFVRHADNGSYPRHPVQLYEALWALSVFMVLFLVDRRLGKERLRWLLTGLFFSLYFGGRMGVEQFKAYLVLDPSFPLAMGQILSIPMTFVGMLLIIVSLYHRKKDRIKNKS